MKVIQSIDVVFESQRLLNEKLKNRVDGMFQRLKQENWHYFSRLKKAESFALKLETGRFSESSKLEDFFACTIVVDNLDQIKKALELVKKKFVLNAQRPKDLKFTHKDPSSFQFDDLRLYVTLKDDPSLPPEVIANIVFEVQIKTFIQHAWGVATHDLIYKSNEINWSKERIAYQIKAVLEQAETTIAGVSKLISLPEVAKENPESKLNKKILAFYQQTFDHEDLPADVVRLCRNTKDLLSNLKVEINNLKVIIEKENTAGRGVNLRNLSPYLIVLQSIIYQIPDVVQNYLHLPDQKFKILMPGELNLAGMNITSERNMIKMQ